MPTTEWADNSPISLTCFVASTPWAGGWRLGQLLGQSDGIDPPTAWFDPLRVPYRSRTLSIPLGAADWTARYLEAVGMAATRKGIGWVSLQWNHLRWLLQIARVAVPAPRAERARLDTEVLAAWFPEPRFVWVASADTAGQALRWYGALHPEVGRDPSPDGAGPTYRAKCPYTNLTDFGRVDFSGAKAAAGGPLQALSVFRHGGGPHAVTMLAASGGVRARPRALSAGGDGFRVTWVHE